MHKRNPLWMGALCLLLLWSQLSLEGCQCGASMTCQTGSDCPSRHYCLLPEGQCTPLRDAACRPGERRDCRQPNGIGVCRFGSQWCTARYQWGPCSQANTPTTELCDGKDNDCDGQIDEGCTSTPCTAPTVRCGNACVNTNTDNQHCGTCGRPCSALQRCLNGQCVGTTSCADGQLRCDGVCVDPRTSAQHCGGCNKPCSSGQVCAKGTCSTTCPSPDLVACSGACVDIKRDKQHCGQCGNVCPSLFRCIEGTCSTTCPKGWTLCGTTCADLRDNPLHCGKCSNKCPSKTRCSQGTCEPICGPSCGWVQHIKPQSSQLPGRTLGMAIDAAQNLYILGESRSSVTIAGQRLATSGAFLLKLNDQGTYLRWTPLPGLELPLRKPLGIAASPTGDVYIAGRGTIRIGGKEYPPQGTGQLLLFALSSSGQPMWAQTATWTSSSVLIVMAVTYDKGFLYLTGQFKGTVTLGKQTLKSSHPTLFVSKLRADGSFVWSQAIPPSLGATSSIGRVVRPSTNGELLVGGYCQGDNQFVSGLCSRNGGALILRLASNGTFLSSVTSRGTSAVYDFLPPRAPYPTMAFGSYQGTVDFGNILRGNGTNTFLASFSNSKYTNAIDIRRPPEAKDGVWPVGVVHSGQNIVFAGELAGSVANRQKVVTVSGKSDGLLALWDGKDWSLLQRIGGDTDDADEITGIVSDPFGGVYVVGYFTGNASGFLTSNGSVSLSSKDRSFYVWKVALP